MSETQKLKQDIAELRQQIAELHEYTEALHHDLVRAHELIAENTLESAKNDAWAYGIYEALKEPLAYLLRGHPDAAKVGEILRIFVRRYEQLERNPDLAEPDEYQEVYEAGKMFYTRCAWAGIWPDVDKQAFVEQAKRRFVRQYGLD